MILVVDHYDSFTYNLVQLIESLGHETEVVKSDAEPAEALVARAPAAVILSPGPGRPESAGCFTDLLEALAADTSPCSACASGTRRSASSTAARSTAPSPSTARPRRCVTTAAASSRACTTPSRPGATTRWSWNATTCPTSCALTAWTEDGLVMGTQHRELPRYGVQFHPESILTPEGPTIVRNFLALAG